MERIKQALKKSRQQSNLISMQHRGEGAVSISLLAGPIVYRQTRVIPLTPAIASRERIIAFNLSDPQCSVFDILRTKIVQEMEKNGWRTLAITSPTRGCGKTVVAINLAMAIAQSTDRTAMLVDFDFQKPKVASYLGLMQDLSVSDVLTGRAAVSEVLVNPDLPRLVLMPTHQPVQSPTQLLSSPQATALIRELWNRYADRIVLFDLPPILGTDGAIAVLPNIDCVLLVVGDGESTPEEIEQSVRQLPGSRFLGAVLNKSNSP